VVAQSIASLHETFAPGLSVAPGARRRATRPTEVHVVVVTTGGNHLLDHLTSIAPLFEHVDVDVPSVELGFAVHRVLAEYAGTYDYYCYVEDDLVIRDALFFDKLSWFVNSFGRQFLLQPNRFEISGGIKAYPDGPQPPEATARLREPDGPNELRGTWFGLDVGFEHPSNPFSASFFLDAEQFDRVRGWAGFGVPSADFVGPLESAGMVAPANVLRIYKAAPPLMDFLELQHCGTRYLTAWAVPDAAHAIAAARQRAEMRLELTERELSTVYDSTSWRVTLPLRAAGRLMRSLGLRRRSVPGSNIG